MRALRHLGFAVALLALAACSSSGSSKSSAGTTPATAPASATSAPASTSRPLRVLVTNDDGVSAPGIDALVQALRVLPNTDVTVVAPLTNNSGTGSKTTPGTLVATDAKTKSGYPAKAVHGYPADTITWATAQGGVAEKPDVVLSGINFGQNIGASVDLSGTIGAARAAAQHGIPALAVSASLQDPDYATAAKNAVEWLEQHRAALLAGAPATVTNLNVPSCPPGKLRAEVEVPVAGREANALAPTNCNAPATKPTSDVDGFTRGFVVRTDDLPLRPAA